MFRLVLGLLLFSAYADNMELVLQKKKEEVERIIMEITEDKVVSGKEMRKLINAVWHLQKELEQSGVKTENLDAGLIQALDSYVRDGKKIVNWDENGQMKKYFESIGRDVEEVGLSVNYWILGVFGILFFVVFLAWTEPMTRPVAWVPTIIVIISFFIFL